MAKRIFFARYQQEQPLGEGGIGQVFKVLDLWENREKALKFLKPEFKSTPIEDAFRQEFSLLSRIKHPNIVPGYDYQSRDNLHGPAYSLELVQGPGLVEFHKSQPEQFDWIMLQVCQILEFIHLQGIVHCDLKPDNFKVIYGQGDSHSPTVKLLDFGLAESAELIKESKIKGTLDYMAPEILRSEPYNFTADLYSLGVILYQLTTGQLPFRADDPAVLISRVLEQEPIPPGSINDRIPQELEDLILGLLVKNPHQRTASASLVKEFFAARMGPASLPGFRCQPFLESVNFAPPATVWPELRGLVRTPSFQAKKVALVGGVPRVGKSRVLKELKSVCQTEGIPVIYYRLSGALTEWWDGLGQRLLFLCANSSIPELQSSIKTVERALSCQNAEEKTKIAAQVLSELPLVFLLDGLNFQGDSGLVRCLSENQAFQKSLVIIAVSPFVQQSTLLEKFIHSHPATERIEFFQLQPLDFEKTKCLVQECLPQVRLTPGLVAGIWNSSGGNPGLILEGLQRLWQTGKLVFDQGQIKRVKTRKPSPPPTAEAEQYLRFVEGCLNPAQKEFLQQISVLGQKFDLLAAVHLAQANLDQSYEYLGYLFKEGIVCAEVREDVPVYCFSPPALQQYFYQNLSFQQKNDLHLRAALYYENQQEQGNSISPDILAAHFLRCHQPEKTYHYSLLSAEAALKTLAKKEILFHLGNAYQAAGQMENQEEKILRQAQVLRKRAHFWKTIGNFHKALVDYRQLLKLFEKKAQQKIVAEAYKDLGDLFRLKNNWRKGMVYLRRAEEIYRVLDDKPALAHTLNNIGNLYWIALQYQLALEYLNSALQLHHSLGNLAGAASTLNNLAGVYLATNQFQKSIEYYQQSLEIHRRLQIPEEISRVVNNLGVVYMYTAQYHQALKSLLESLTLNQKTGNLREQVFNLENLGECYQRMGDQSQSLGCSRQGLTLAEQIGFTLRKGRILRNLAKSQAELAEYSQALEDCQKALESARLIEDTETQAWVLVDMAEIHIQLNLENKARELLAQADPLVAKLKDNRLTIHYHLVGGQEKQLRTEFSLAAAELEKAEKIAKDSNLMEEELISRLDRFSLDLEQSDLASKERELIQLKSLCQQGNFSHLQVRLGLAEARFYRLSGQGDQALEAAEPALQKALQQRSWEFARELAYLNGLIWQERKNLEQAYLYWEQGVTILRKVYQKITQPEFKQAYLQGKNRQTLVSGFKKIAELLAGQRA
jgi:serine/threonine protein kinase/tetratricopeptide (TPR) repeat protein